MKTISISLLVFVCALLAIDAQAQTKIIERPVFDFWSSRTLEIDKIELTDTETILYIDAFYRPNNWIKIDSKTYIRENGKEEKLIIKGAEGIELDKEFYMPESGEASFKLIFPAINKNTAKIDFIESDCDGCFKIWGIYLDGKPAKPQLPPSVLVTTLQATQPLPKPEIKKGSAILSGQIFGNIPSEPKYQLLTTQVANIITGEEEEYWIPIGKDGKFSIEIPVLTPTITYLDSHYYSGRIYLIPGETTELYVDANKMCMNQSRYHCKSEKTNSMEHAYIKGSLNLSATGLNKLDVIYQMINRRKMLNDVYNMNPEDYKTYLLQNMSNYLQSIKEDKSMSVNIQEIMYTDIKLYILLQLLSYQDNMKGAYSIKHNLNRDEMENSGYSRQEPDKSYYSFLKDFDLNNPYYLYLQYYPYVISNIMDIRTLNTGEMPLTASWFSNMKKEFGPYIGSNSGIFFDIAAAKQFAKSLAAMKPLTDTETKELDKIFTNKTIISELLAENEKTKKLIEESKKMPDVNIYDVPDVAQDKAFDAIIAKYKGKVVFVDFWATWCGPCRAAMKEAKPVKEEFNGKDVVFLYLTNSSSPVKTWKKMLPDIHEDHYRITSDKLWDYWSKTFEINGIPAYFIYDKEGNLKHRSSGFMGVDKMREWIKESL